MHTDAFRPCVVIPVYNHSATLEQTVRALRQRQLPVILVDDGSDAGCRALMAAIVAATDQVQLLRRERNGGKGAAVKDGLRHARQQRFSHALQIDADGQHDLGDVERFLQLAQAQPEALVAGFPVFDETVPRHRYYGRYLCHVWVWINTMSTQIRDSMCGFRVYPLAASCTLLANRAMGNRMDFDCEFIIHWHWAGLPLEQLQTRVIYPADGVSHFRLWRDNALFSLLHARLFFAMLPRLPSLIRRNVSIKRMKS
jgi:glycosyltransferase involved in cell wall biosynthesis